MQRDARMLRFITCPPELSGFLERLAVLSVDKKPKRGREDLFVLGFFPVAHDMPVLGYPGHVH